MKTLFLLLFVWPVANFAQSDPAAYYTKINDHYESVNYYISAIADESQKENPQKERCESLIRLLSEAVNLAVNDLESLGSFDGDDQFRLAALDLFRFFKILAEKDYPRIIGLAFTTGRTAEQSGELERLQQTVTAEHKRHLQAYSEAETAFYDRYDFDWDEDLFK